MQKLKKARVISAYPVDKHGVLDLSGILHKALVRKAKKSWIQRLFDRIFK